MTIAIPVYSPTELSLALGAISSDILPAKESLLLVAATDLVAEYDHALLEAAHRLASELGVPVISLNELIWPYHPLGLTRVSLVSQTAFVERLHDHGCCDDITQVAYFSLADRHRLVLAQITKAKLLRVNPRRIDKHAVTDFDAELAPLGLAEPALVSLKQALVTKARSGLRRLRRQGDADLAASLDFVVAAIDEGDSHH